MSLSRITESHSGTYDIKERLPGFSEQIHSIVVQALSSPKSENHSLLGRIKESDPSSSSLNFDRSKKVQEEYLDSLGIFLPPDCDAPYFLKKHVLEGKIPASKITISDFIPEKVGEYEEWIKDHLFFGMSTRLFASLNRFYNKEYGSHFTVDTLNAEKRAELNQKVELYIWETLRIKLEAFRKNTTLKEMADLQLQYPLDFWAQAPLDFDIKGLHKNFGNPKPCASKSFLAEKGHQDLVKRLQRKRSQKVHSKRVEKAFYDLDQFCSHINQIQCFIQIAKALKKPIQDLNEMDLGSFNERLQIIINQENKKKEEEAERIAQELLKEENVSAATRSIKKGKSHKKKTNQPVRKLDSTTKNISLSTEMATVKPTPSFTPLKQAILKLNDSKIRYQLQIHSRIRRWEISDLNKVRTFEDFDPVSKRSVKHYEHYSTHELIKLRAFHRIPGIERLLSVPKLRDTYSYEYQYIPLGSEKVHNGRGLYSEVKIGKEKFSGIIYVGISSNGMIYHAMFEPLEEGKLLASQLAKKLEEYIPNDGDEENWELASDFSFNLLENDKILLEIGKKSKDRIEYHIYPIQ